MKQYTTLLFDADNTLLDFDATEKQALRETFQMYKIKFCDKMEKRYYEINKELWNLYEIGEISREDVIYSRFKMLFAEFKIDEDGKEFEDVYQKQLGKGHHVVANAMDIVIELSKRYNLYIVSNGVTATQYSRLRDSGLRPYFKDVFISEEIHARKPMREFFTHCFSHMKDIELSNMLIIGDSLSSDMQGGINAGIDTCWFNPNHQKNKDKLPITYEIDCLLDLLMMLKEDI